MMVSLGAALIMIVSSFGFMDVLGGDNIILDPSRVAAQVVSGIGFIGAGTILFLNQNRIRGLTTASGLWTVAAIGLATGGGMYFASGAATLLALIILWALQPLEKRITQRFKQKTLSIEANRNALIKDILGKIEENKEINFSNFSIDKNENGVLIQLKFESLDMKKFTGLVSSLQSNPDINKVYWSE
jgi:putative Mg2+ transporter-C (MgtC) family protein